MWPDLGVDAVRGLSGAWERLTRDKWGWEGGLIMDKKYGTKNGSGNREYAPQNIYFLINMGGKWEWKLRICTENVYFLINWKKGGLIMEGPQSLDHTYKVKG